MSEYTYETAIKRLREIVKLLENGGLPLEESVKLFEEGAKLSKFCNDELRNAERKITDLSEVNEESENE